MKKIFAIICSVLLLAACHDELVDGQMPDVVEGEKVELTFDAHLPGFADVTKSFEQPAISSLYLIVFDNNGYLVEKCKADPVSGWSVSTTQTTKFNVTLTASASKRTIHFIANYNGPDQLQFGSESDVVGGMLHENGADAYWQRVEFDGGINEYTLVGETVYLLRNNCRIKVSESLSNFQFNSFTMVNVVTQGYVSPYNKNTGTFAQFVENATCRSYSDITNGSTGYEGYVPTVNELNLNTSISAVSAWTASGSYFYMYERSFESENHTFMLIEGKYDSDRDGFFDDENVSYYKVDLVYNDDYGVTQYYHMLRNFEYNVIITEVTAAGKSTPELAAAMTGSHNNLVASVETRNLTNISNGEAQLYVSYTKEYIVSSDPVTLYYKYIPDIDSPNVTDNGKASVIVGTGEIVRATVTATADETSGEYQGWRKITVYPNAPEDDAKSQEVTIKAGDLTRAVTYALVNPYEMSAKCISLSGNDVVSTTINSAVTVQVTIPGNLPESIFPLTFYVEAMERTLHPDAAKNQLPVEVIPESLYDGVEETFGYMKELTLAEYNALTTSSGKKTFDLYFYTNTENSASSVYVYNKYFNIAVTRFNNYLSNISLSGTEYYGEDNLVTLQFDAVSGTTYTITSSQLKNITQSTANGVVTVTGFTNLFYGVIEITVVNGGTEVIVGRNRNKLKVGKLVEGSNCPGPNELVRVYNEAGVILGSGLWSEYLAGTMEIKVEGLTSQNLDVGQLAYTIDGVTYASQMYQAPQLMSGEPANFNQVN